MEHVLIDHAVKVLMEPGGSKGDKQIFADTYSVESKTSLRKVAVLHALNYAEMPKEEKNKISHRYKALDMVKSHFAEELIRNNHLDDANMVSLKGAKGGLRATDEIYDLLIEEDCKAGDHSNALTIAYEMEAAGRMATTFHFNHLLSVQATCGIPEIAFATFENLEYGEVREAIRHFRALKNFNGGTVALYNDGNFGDPLSLYLRALCREGMIVELIEALEAMGKDNQQIPPRAMILSRKYRTLVSSWIEPLQEEAELGYEIDFVARWRSYGGAQVVGATQRKTPLDPDAERFIYSNPMETSFKQRCLEDWKLHHRKLLKTLKNEGLACLGDASESDYVRVEERLRKIIKGPDQNVPKPKAASKMIVAELKEELEAQGLPTDGTRNVLYQRVQKARRINRSRGRPLWVPPVEEEEEEVDEELDRLISRIKLEDGNTEFWRRRFLGEDLNEGRMTPTNTEKTELLDTVDEEDVVDDVAKEEDEVDEEEEVEPTENQDGDMAKEKEVETAKPLQMIGVQLLKDVDQTPTRKGKSRRRSSRISVEDDNDDDWFPEDVREALNVMRERKIFDVSHMYTIADAWGWTWERELRNRPPRKWSQEWEVELAMQVMLKNTPTTLILTPPIPALCVIELGGTPTIGDCAMILRAAIRAPLPSAFLKILQTTHNLGYVFGSPLYDEIITLCLDLGELDAAIAIIADMKTAGITVPDQIVDKLLSAKQSIDDVVKEDS
ncbi:hypothetical protein Syun_006494 [Stephania yunnanensis]|uniref:SAP domain-containing protein n=1 Tax=Stephania yunnanensis TaxID=152371 RepID=A0AAP0KWP5_9MAGN